MVNFKVTSSICCNEGDFAYRYRKWDLDGIDLIVRSKIDAAVLVGSNNEALIDISNSSHDMKSTGLATVHALFEFDSRAIGAGGSPDWRQKLDAQKGAVMASELKNNGSKLARWTMEALLGGVDQIRLGFCSRAQAKDRKRHVVLGSSIFKPTDIGSHLNVNMDNGWAIVKEVVALIDSKTRDGKYVLLKDPNKAILHLYQATLDM